MKPFLNYCAPWNICGNNHHLKGYQIGRQGGSAGWQCVPFWKVCVSKTKRSAMAASQLDGARNDP
jgi:hypothetical protein